MKTALISVYDKSGLEPFARRLTALGFKIISTGKTAAFLKSAGVEVQEISDYTGFPEIFEGRVKTLHPKIHAGILARASDQKVLADLGAAVIDLVAVNLYPFEATPSIENIDIGGPTLLRAAAKNFERVWAVCDPADYERVAAVLEAAEAGAENGSAALELRRELAGKVFCRTARYETAIAKFFAARKLRYGENPHQAGWFLPGFGGENLWESLETGKEISYNNILDADAAWWLIREFDGAAKETATGESFVCAIIKHSNPCGVAVSRESLVKAFEQALSCDPTSAFGGIVALNREVDAICAEALASIFLEVILAPGFSGEARKILAKKKNLQLLVSKKSDGPAETLRSAAGGLLIQEADDHGEPGTPWSVTTKREPTPAELRALQFAWKVVKHAKSNAIVFSDEEKTLGIGAGQTSRIDSVKLAIQKYKQVFDSNTPTLKHSNTVVVASDAFFPFADNIEAIAQAQATAVIQPGGSVKDAEVIAAADRHNLAMVFTGVRHFRH